MFRVPIAVGRLALAAPIRSRLAAAIICSVEAKDALSVQTNEFHSTTPIRRKTKKEWVQDQSQREVDAILDAKQHQKNERKLVQLSTLDGEDLGIMKKRDAAKLADERNLKLVPIDEKAEPMIFQLMNGKELAEYHRAHKPKHKKVLKRLQLTLSITDHDLEMKFKQVENWLEHGHGVDMDIKSNKLKTDPELGGLQADFFKRIVETFQDHATVSQSTRTEAHLHVSLRPKKDAHSEESTEEEHS